AHVDAVLAVGRPGERAPAVDLGDLVLLHQEVHALDDAGRNLARALVRGTVGHRGVSLDAELGLLVGQHVGEFGVLEESLGGDAADVEAHTSPVLLLDHCDGLAELGCADRRDVASWTGPKDKDVVVGHDCQTILHVVTLYAAYGTNLDPARMSERCPHSPLRTTGWLEGWRLTFGGEEHGWDGPLATIVEDPFEQVFVAVYDLTDDDAAALESWESPGPGLYLRTKVRVKSLTG